MELFTMAVGFNEAEIKMNCLTPELVAITTYNLVKKYWENLGISVDVEVYADFDTIVY